jgi:uncharacterized membrane protein YoaK (UPF0700 family)
MKIRLSDRRERQPPALLVLLAVLTGVIDAVSILSMGRVFVANVIGDVVSVAFALAGAPGFSASAAIFAIGGFVEGALLTGVGIGHLVGRRRAPLRVAVLVQLGLLVIAFVVALAVGTPYGAGARDAIVAVCSFAMGSQKVMVRKLAVSTLTTAMLAMLAGALVGTALVLTASPTAALGLALGLVAILAGTALVLSRRRLADNG